MKHVNALQGANLKLKDSSPRESYNFVTIKKLLPTYILTILTNIINLNMSLFICYAFTPKLLNRS